METLETGFDLNVLERSGAFVAVGPMNAPEIGAAYFVTVMASNVSGVHTVWQSAINIATGVMYGRIKTAGWSEWTAGGGGAPGEPGASAYEVAVANGFEGDVGAWLASLVGPTGAAGNSGVLYSTLSAARTLTSTTSMQPIFEPGHDEIALEAAMTYLVDGLVAITGMSTASGNLAFSLLGAGTATILGGRIDFVGAEGSFGATGAARIGSLSASNADSLTPNLLNPSTATQTYFRLTGKIRTNAAGTIIPSIALQTAAAAVLDAECYIELRKLGPNSQISVGAP